MISGRPSSLCDIHVAQLKVMVVTDSDTGLCGDVHYPLTALNGH